MSGLMLGEGADLNIPVPADVVPDDEAAIGEHAQEPVDVLTAQWVVAEELAFDPQRAILEPAFAIGEVPQAGEEESAFKWQFG
jgi:hypothetical protein